MIGKRVLRSPTTVLINNMGSTATHVEEAMTNSRFSIKEETKGQQPVKRNKIGKKEEKEL